MMEENKTNEVIYRFNDLKYHDKWMERRSYGLGASEAEVYTGHSKYDSQDELWEIKVGLRPPKPTTEAMERGHRLEPIVRERFMQKYGWAFEIEYFQYGMYYRTDYPMLFATLDGVLIAKCNVTIDFGDGKVYMFRKGQRIILEIKNPAPRDYETYLSWNVMPEGYRWQAAQQMFCSGIDVQIMVANITGEYQKGEVDERIFVTTADDLKAETDEITKTAPMFWKDVQNKKRPATTMELTPSSMVSLAPKLSVGQILDNFDKCKASIQSYADKYKGFTFTEENKKKGKDVRAELNKHKDEIDTVRKGVKKQWIEPLTAFEDRCNELIAIIDEVEKPIGEQIKKMESEAKEHKETLIKEEIERTIRNEYPNLENMINGSGGIKIEPKWLNATTSAQTVTKGIHDALEKAKGDLETLQSFKAHVDVMTWAAMFNEFLKTGRDVHKALETKDAMQKAKEVEALQTTPQKPIAPPEQKESTSETKVYRKVVEFSHEDKNEMVALIAYLKEHGFKCREVTLPTESK